VLNTDEGYASADGALGASERQIMKLASGVRIGVMSDTDLGRVRELRGSVGWTADPLAFDLLRGVRDARWAVADASGGASAGSARGALAGMVGVVPLGRIGMVIHVAVREEMRGLGVGWMLSSWAVAYLRSRGVETVRLYSTLEAEGLYEDMGFVPIGRRAVYRLVGSGVKEVRANDADGEYAVTPLRFGEAPELCGADYWAYGGDRAALILATLRLHRGRGWLARDASGQIKGYLISSRSDSTVRLGPLAAATPKAAHLLVSTALIEHACADIEHGTVSAALTVPARDGAAETPGHILLEGLGFSGRPDRLCMELRTGKDAGNLGTPGSGLTLYGTTPYLAT
jgi:ribosomal protein S18 acetylase RimI-like enzyme